MEIYTVNLERAVNSKWREEQAESKELGRKRWWNDIMPMQVYDLPTNDEEMEGGYNDGDDQD